jgi:hypothetical protein
LPVGIQLGRVLCNSWAAAQPSSSSFGYKSHPCFSWHKGQYKTWKATQGKQELYLVGDGSQSDSFVLDWQTLLSFHSLMQPLPPPVTCTHVNSWHTHINTWHSHYLSQSLPGTVITWHSHYLAQLQYLKTMIATCHENSDCNLMAILIGTCHKNPACNL